MSRSSPSVGRIAAILGFIASHPEQEFGMTDLVRALKISRATCHSLLVGLVEVGYLYRTAEKTYVLGPTLLSLASVAADNFSPMQVAQPEMRLLADEFDVVCSACYLDEYTVEVRERAASITFVGHSISRGSRMKVRVPYAAVFLAWREQQAIDTWLDGYLPEISQQQRDLQLASIAFARKYGFVLFAGDPDWNEKLSAQQWLSGR